MGRPNMLIAHNIQHHHRELHLSTFERAKHSFRFRDVRSSHVRKFRIRRVERVDVQALRTTAEIIPIGPATPSSRLKNASLNVAIHAPSESSCLKRALIRPYFYAKKAIARPPVAVAGHLFNSSVFPSRFEGRVCRAPLDGIKNANFNVPRSRLFERRTRYSTSKHRLPSHTDEIGIVPRRDTLFRQERYFVTARAATFEEPQKKSWACCVSR